MKKAEIDYAKAGEIALVAMGRTEIRKNSPSKWKAEDDPLAWWCLTEWIAEQGACRD